MRCHDRRHGVPPDASGRAALPLVGIGLRIAVALVDRLPITDQAALLGFVLVVALIGGSGCIVFAGNGLVWRLLLPRLTPAQPMRARIIAVVTAILALVSIPLTALVAVVPGLLIPGI